MLITREDTDTAMTVSHIRKGQTCVLFCGSCLFIDFVYVSFCLIFMLSLGIDYLLTIMFKHCTYIPSYISYAKVYSYVAPLHLAIPMLRCAQHDINV